jgi:hypothetical protein
MLQSHHHHNNNNNNNTTHKTRSLKMLQNPQHPQQQITSYKLREAFEAKLEQQRQNFI